MAEMEDADIVIIGAGRSSRLSQQHPTIDNE